MREEGITAAEAWAPGEMVAHRYEVESHLGESDTTSAYRAKDALRGDAVALSRVARDEPAQVDVLRRALRGLVHPHLLHVRDLGWLSRRGCAFYAAELVRGVRLEVFADAHPWSAVAGALGNAVEALHWLHGLGLRHGDIQPSNILVRPGGAGVLIDLSCSQPFGAPPRALGEAGFLAPEILAGRRADRRADLYALGITVKRLIEGRSDVPAGVRALVSRLLQASPERRPADAFEVARALGRSPTPWAPQRDPPLLFERGRATEAFDDLLAALSEGAPWPRALVLHGPAGSGRTRLLEELGWKAQQALPVVAASVRQPLRCWLERACGHSLPPGPAAVQALLERVERPLIMLMDDAERAAEPALLDLLLRALPPKGPLSLLLAADRPLPAGARAETVALHALEPLGSDAIRRWTSGRLPPSRAADVRRLTGGLPGAIRALLSPGPSDDELARGASLRPHAERAMAELAALAAEMRAPLVRLAVGGQVPRLDVDPDTLARLLAEGWLAEEPAGFRLGWRSDAAHILKAAGAEETARAHRALASALHHELLAAPPDSPEASRAAAGLVRHLLAAGDEAGLHSALGATDALRRRHPEPWLDTAGALLASFVSVPSVLEAAEMLVRAGQPAEALGVVVTLRRARRAEPALLWRLAGSAYLRAGSPKRAARYLRRALAAEPPAAAHSPTAALLERALSQAAPHEERRRAPDPPPEDTQEQLAAMAAQVKKLEALTQAQARTIEELREHLRAQERAPCSPPRTREEHLKSEEEQLRQALGESDWNVSETARRLGVSRPTVYRRMRRYGLDR